MAPADPRSSLLTREARAWKGLGTSLWLWGLATPPIELECELRPSHSDSVSPECPSLVEILNGC